MFCAGGRLPVGFGGGLPAGWFPCDPGWPGVTRGVGAFKFGGISLAAFGDPPGTLPVGDCFITGEPGVVGFPPGPVREPPGVPEGFTVCEAPGVAEGFAPSRFGGTDLLAAPAAFGEAPGTTFGFGGPAPGFTKLGGSFCPIPAGGEPVTPGDTVAPGEPVTCPLLPNCRFTKGVGFGRSFGGGFCSAMVFLSNAASCGLTPCHPFWT